ncbi:PQQ-binding-like beta-propeller repeat protein [Phenylobacterium sp.]|jgi:polyvinyl alcohol dehydrogenase (cytochrome)|uniref:outer membrane protein assembly factor BamB family protein n=1 Tax=Phenylobacterium sp. TaxID=1871053 RepID=UPI002F9536C8
MRVQAWVAGALALGFAAVFGAPLAMGAEEGPPDGQALFNSRCKGCHEPAVERAADRRALAAMPQAHIVQVLTNGVMAPMAAGLTAADKQAIAAYLAPAPASRGRQLSAQQLGVDKMCAGPAPVIRPTGSDWTSVGFEPTSHRFQPNPGLSKADVPKLKVKWAFAMPGGSMPTVIGDWLYMANRTGKLYALDAKTGCVRWVRDDVTSRTTPMIVKTAISPSGWATFVGERTRTVRAIDAQTGKDIWKSPEIESHRLAGITGTPLVVGDQVFVPTTSGEEGGARANTYECCTFRGSLVALDLKTGAKQWQTYVITEPLGKLGKNSAGTQMWGPAGGAIWSAPSADPKRGLVYVATGDSYVDAPTKGADAIVAMDMKTGKIRWSHQVTENDNFITGCYGTAVKPANCPEELGPDFDFGATPIVHTLKTGRQIVLSGQKSGIVYGMDPDTGKLLWKTTVGVGSSLGGIEWGMAADNQRLYVANADIGGLFEEIRRGQGKPPEPFIPYPPNPGLSAIDPATGKILWQTKAPKAPCRYHGDRSRDRAPGGCIRAQSAAPSAMPGVVFSGTVDGWFRGYDSATGKIIWAHSTTEQTYDTVNGVKGQPGGSIDGLGPAIASGMVYTMSGFNGAANTGGNGVNVLLAYSVDGK